MARDYKPRRKARRGPGWGGAVAGLGLGLAVAVGIYLRDHRSAPPAGTPPAGKPPAAAPANGAPANGAASTAAASSPRAGASQAGTPAGEPYAFYDMLPKFSVTVPEKERNKPTRPEVKAAPETRRGTYVLQAGSYHTFAEADRMRAKLALKGIESKVQKVALDGDTWLRVRIGPISNLDELNRLRDALRRADVDVQVIRVGD